MGVSRIPESRNRDHEPTPDPSQEGNCRRASAVLFPSWEGSGVGRFMGRRNWNRIVTQWLNKNSLLLRIAQYVSSTAARRSGAFASFSSSRIFPFSAAVGRRDKALK